MQRAYKFRKEEYHDGDVIHIELAQEVSFLNKAAIKSTLNDIPENSKVIIDAKDTVYIAHDILDLIHEFKTTRAKDDNIKVNLIGFKEAYQLENSKETPNKVTFEHYYDVAKRKTVQRETLSEDFLK
jgi:MFS superfamily sulfate permease-like transporter